jgi:hypothetical protein
MAAIEPPTIASDAANAATLPALRRSRFLALNVMRPSPVRTRVVVTLIVRFLCEGALGNL